MGINRIRPARACPLYALLWDTQSTQITKTTVLPIDSVCDTSFSPSLSRQLITRLDTLELRPSRPMVDRKLIKMDPFNKLPPELRLQIFARLRYKGSIFQLVQASPVMLEQYATSKEYITRTLFYFDLDKNMIHDAMGIILFPSREGCDFLKRMELTCRHIDVWAARKLPNPFENHDRRLINELDKLHDRLLLCIEDYLTKAATDDLLPPEYGLLPDISSVRSFLALKGQTVSTGSNVVNLTSPERKHLLRNFLRHEFLRTIDM